MLSVHDREEKLYHGFVLGMLATLEPEYQVRSNRESGQGRPDVLIRPTRPCDPGVVLEFKVARGGRTLQAALADGVRCISEKEYAAELRGLAGPVYAFAVAFDGKEVRVRAVPIARG
ncbi:PD-(D/E)XK nuclease domain-containing protein [Polyangium aurulentum]|uniref:PD-(D/E)XK nuclease domain-containing protein n=1 Tax=Polyangium aurulentum TaxID=2567896 RepID=UPI0023DFFB45|nr:PD-(D/E)XK nuclease domain-containing protein [Polyangium aurulentum]